MLALLADSSAAQDYPTAIITIVVGAVLIGLINAVKILLDIVSFFRRTPSADERYATKLELARASAEMASDLRDAEARMIQSEARLSASIATLTSRSETDSTGKDKKLDSILRELQGIAARIGRLEGLAEAER